MDTSFALFGQTVDLPVFAAPVGAMQLHYGDKYDDLAYNDILVAAPRTVMTPLRMKGAPSSISTISRSSATVLLPATCSRPWPWGRTRC